MTAPLPRWLQDVPPADRPYAKRRYLMRLAALLHSREGHTLQLARAVGLSNKKSLGVFMTLQKQRKMPRRMADAIEKATDGIVAADALMDDEI